MKKEIQNYKHSTRILPDNEVEKLAIEAGLQKRTYRKISAPNLLEILCVVSVNEAPSYNDLAIRMENMTEVSVSKQAFWKKINTAQSVSFFKLILATIMKPIESIKSTVKLTFNRIPVQDSTVIKLPQRLFPEYSGVSNGHRQVCNARIQSVYDLLTGEFILFSIDPYKKNDLDASSEFNIEKGDLILRDRGYCSYKEIKRIKDNNADTIMRHKFNTVYLEPKTFKPVELLPVLKKLSGIDMTVCLNDKDKTIVRLVAEPVKDTVANARRMKARRDANGHTLKKKALDIMSWTIFITTIQQEKASFSQLFELYSLRWRIENIFKTWKGNLQFCAVHNVSKYQFLSIMMARMVMIVLALSKIFIPLQHFILVHFKRTLSLMKSIRYLQINNNILQVVDAIKLNQINLIVMPFAKYCTYDLRQDRSNFSQKQFNAFLDFKLS